MKVERTVFISLELEDLQTLITDCVNSCLMNSKHLNIGSAPEIDRWFNLIELCQYHPDKPTKPTVYGWVNAGIIPVHKSGKKLRFLKSEIDEWLKNGKKKTKDEIENEADEYLKKRYK